MSPRPLPQLPFKGDPQNRLKAELMLGVPETLHLGGRSAFHGFRCDGCKHFEPTCRDLKGARIAESNYCHNMSLGYERRT